MAENDQKQLSSDNQLPPADLLQLILGGNIDQLQDQFQLNLVSILRFVTAVSNFSNNQCKYRFNHR